MIYPSVVVSRRALLEEEQRASAAEIRRSIVVGEVMTGRVTPVREFGAVVDLGGGVQRTRSEARYVSNQCYHTYVPKLTLSVDENVVRGAKRYAAARGTSVSRLVERYLDLLSRPFDMAQAPPVLRMLRGAARKVPADAHRKHLARKYR